MGIRWSREFVARERSPRRTMQRNHYSINRTSKASQNHPYRPNPSSDRIWFLRRELLVIIAFIVYLVYFALPPVIDLKIFYSDVLNLIFPVMLLVIGCIFILCIITTYGRSKRTNTNQRKSFVLPKEKAWRLCPACTFRNDFSVKVCLKCGSDLKPKLDIRKYSSDHSTQTSPSGRLIPEPVKLNKMAYDIRNKSGTCQECGAIIPPFEMKCPKCGKSRSECPICRRYLNYNDDIAYCFYCQNDFHFSHLAEFVKTKGFCPMCRQKLISSEVVRKYQ